MDGTQTHVFMFDTPEYRELGFGFTATGIHEFGHHVGMSHPHDGYDSELDLDFGPGGSFEFAWSGDESHTVMHYLALTNGFGGSTRTTRTAGRWPAISTGRTPWRATSWRIPRPIARALLLWFADAAAAEALDEFKKWDYVKAAATARLAYSLVITAARQIGAETPTLNAARRALPDSHFPRDGCRIRYMYQ